MIANKEKSKTQNNKQSEKKKLNNKEIETHKKNLFKKKVEEEWRLNIENAIEEDKINKLDKLLQPINISNILKSSNSIFMAISLNKLNIVEKIINDYPSVLTNTIDQEVNNIKMKLDPLLFSIFMQSLPTNVLKERWGKDLHNQNIESFKIINFIENKSSDNLVNDKDKLEGNTALHIAALMGKISLVKFLVNKKKVNIDQKNKQENTPLLLAYKGQLQSKKSPDIEEEYSNVVKFLKDNGKGNITADDAKGNTVLSLAQLHGSRNFSNNLLKNASVDELRHAAGPNGENAAHRALQKRDLNEFNNIMKRFKENNQGIDDVNKNGKTYNHISASHPLLNDFLKSSLDHGTNIIDSDENGNTPLHISTINNNKDGTDVLLKGSIYKKGDDINKHKDDVKYSLNKPNNDNKTPVSMVLQNGDLNQLSKYINHGGDVNGKMPNGDSLLYFACKQNNIQIITLLLKKGANPNTINGKEKKETCLILAINNNNLPLVKLLIKYNADISIPNKYNNLPLTIAIKKCHLLHKTKKKAECDKSKEIINLLLAKTNKKELDYQDDDGNTILHHLAKIEKDTDTDDKDYKNRIHNIATVLVNNKSADTNIKNDKDEFAKNIAKSNKLKNIIKPINNEDDRETQLNYKTKQIKQLVNQPSCPQNYEYKCVQSTLKKKNNNLDSIDSDDTFHGFDDNDNYSDSDSDSDSDINRNLDRYNNIYEDSDINRDLDRYNNNNTYEDSEDSYDNYY